MRKVVQEVGGRAVGGIREKADKWSRSPCKDKLSYFQYAPFGREMLINAFCLN